jgi:hypothetical protein
VIAAMFIASWEIFTASRQENEGQENEDSENVHDG